MGHYTTSLSVPGFQYLNIHILRYWKPFPTFPTLTLRMETEHCQSTFPGSPRLVKMCWMLGCILSSVGYGALLVLGHACFAALRRRQRGNPRVNKALTAYVLFTVILGTVAEAVDIEVTITGVLDACFSSDLQPPNPYASRFAILLLLINLTTDGLLVSI